MPFQKGNCLNPHGRPKVANAIAPLARKQARAALARLVRIAKHGADPVAVTAANSMVFAAAVYMRAHREEPMLPVSVVTGILTAVSAYFGSRMGVLPMVVIYAVITVCLSLPWTAWLFRGYF